MTKEIIIDGELSCNNCLEKTRCKQQQEVKVQRIDAILSYIANEDNEKYIAELKNEIPAITRCDVVLEKQLKRLEQENKELRKKYSNLLSKNLDKQCKINNLQNKLATQEFSLKVNGKKYAGLSGIEKAKFFINDEIATRNKKILELENFISSFQERVYNYNKKISDLEAENKDLKEQIESQKGLITVGGKQQYKYLQKIDELEQKNKELKSNVLKWQKAFSRQYQINENKGYSKAEENYRSALEEINITVKQLLQGVSSDCINNTPYLTALSLIENKINEVLQ